MDFCCSFKVLETSHNVNQVIFFNLQHKCMHICMYRGLYVTTVMHIFGYMYVCMYVCVCMPMSNYSDLLSANAKPQANAKQCFIICFTKWQPTPVLLLGESQGWRSLVGCHLWGGTESDTTEVT